MRTYGSRAPPWRRGEANNRLYFKIHKFMCETVCVCGVCVCGACVCVCARAPGVGVRVDEVQSVDVEHDAPVAIEAPVNGPHAAR